MRLPGGPLAVAFLLFAAALFLRVLFARAGPDADWPYALVYKGDALLWLRHAAALQRGEPFELGLPLRPPGNAWLLAWLWDGTPAGIARVRLSWQVLGAALAPATFLALRATLGHGRAALAGLLVALSSALIGLASAPNNETPYLLLAVAGLGLHASLARDARRADGPAATTRLAAWALLGAAGCLFRVEHALYVLPALAHLVLLRTRAAGAARGARAAAVALGVLALALAPWHRAAWRAIDAFDRVERPLPPATQAALAAVEQRTSVLLWTPEALAERARLPAFARRSASAFVAATVLHRGGSSVRAEDFGVLDEAFGTRPRPLAARPFVALYGPLNFALANDLDSAGGFDRGPLERPPPLAGGPERYPRALVAGLPPPELALEYPPHLALVNGGYRAGLEAIAAEPGAWLALVGRKLARFLDGVGQGAGGFGLPAGGWDARRAVDLAAPAGPAAEAWTAVLLVGAVLGARRLRRERAPLAPWWIFLAGKLLVTVAFFGYARQGAVAVVALAPLWAAALAPLAEVAVRGRRVFPALGAVLVAVVLVLEVARASLGVSARVDGVPVQGTDPAPAGEHADRRLELELGA